MRCSKINNQIWAKAAMVKKSSEDKPLMCHTEESVHILSSMVLRLELGDYCKEMIMWDVV